MKFREKLQIQEQNDVAVVENSYSNQGLVSFNYFPKPYTF